MANYECKIRTNYFHVKDAERFKEFMKCVCGNEENIVLREEVDADGRQVFGFGCYGGIAGIQNSDGEIDASSYDSFIAGLQEHIADNDVVIIFEAGNEKLRYIVGSASVITAREVSYIDIEKCAIQEVQKLLGNSEWKTSCNY